MLDRINEDGEFINDDYVIVENLGANSAKKEERTFLSR